MKKYMHVVVELEGDRVKELDEEVARLAKALGPWRYRHSLLTDDPRPMNPVAYYLTTVEPDSPA